MYFTFYAAILFTQTKTLRDQPHDPSLKEGRPRLRRSIYTIGMFLRYFDFMHHDVYGDLPVSLFSFIIQTF